MSRLVTRTPLLPAVLLLAAALAACAGSPPTAPGTAAPSVRRSQADTSKTHPSPRDSSVSTMGNYENPSV